MNSAEWIMTGNLTIDLCQIHNSVIENERSDEVYNTIQYTCLVVSSGDSNQ